ncbi:ATPase [Jannaschia sp. Os4]|uniref:ATP12 family protein n=1 Tax=Jannaschia sp. Os4 TaxID=2807617 RepID=UPI00193AA90C|nr:ATPase [Jannaschia sp. Os4]
MSDWAPKRFWTDATVEAVPGGWAVRLDGRPVRTPLKTEVVVPTRALAEGMAAEWRAQEERIDPLSMPLTRAANATLDKVVPQRAEVAAMLAEYGGSDLVSYRAAAPAGLVARQTGTWDPVVEWMAGRGMPMALAEGVMPVAQPAATLAAMRAEVDAVDPWTLTALHEFVTLSGSLALGLAVLHGRLAPEAAWEASRLDETWQAEQWGEDEEEAARVARKRAEFLQAWTWLGLVRSGGGPDSRAAH